MNALTGQTRLVIIGATGMVGGYALRYALENAAVGSVTAIVRRKLGISHPKLQEVLHRDFADCSALTEALSDQEAAVFCPGAYTRAVTDTELRTITVDYTIEFARVLRDSSPDAAFSFLSGNGAYPTGRSRIPSHAIKERRRRHYSRQGSFAFTSSGLRTSTPWSRGRSRLSVIACCAGSTERFGCCSRTR
jgi:nucleoside-diphosphate-sugar epimerase